MQSWYSTVFRHCLQISLLLLRDFKQINFYSTLKSSENHRLFNSLNPLSANSIKWPNTLKQFVDNLPTNCLSVFGHFMGLALKGLNSLVGSEIWRRSLKEATWHYFKFMTKKFFFGLAIPIGLSKYIIANPLTIKLSLTLFRMGFGSCLPLGQSWHSYILTDISH